MFVSLSSGFWHGCGNRQHSGAYNRNKNRRMSDRRGRMKLEKDISVQAFDYIHLALSKYHNHQVYACMRFNGHIQEKWLEQALNLTVWDLPQLVCHFQKGRYVKRETRLRAEVIHVQSAEKRMKSVMAESLDIEKSAQVRVVVIRETRKDTIVVVMSHLLCDGMAMKQYLYLLCGYYNDLAAGRNIVPVFPDKPRDLIWLERCALPTQKMRRIRPKRERLLFCGGEIPLFAQCKIKKDEYRLIRQYLNRHGITMNDLIMGVYYKTLWNVFHYPLRTLCTVIDLRRYMEDPNQIGLCNQTGNAYTTICHAERMPFEKLLAEIHDQMHQEKEQGYCLKQIRLVKAVFSKFLPNTSRKLIRIGISNPQVALTNLGIIDPKRVTFYGLKTIECFLSPSLKRAPNFQLAVSTYQEEMMLQVNLKVSKMEKEAIERFLEEFRCVLLAGISK
ncbi:MAG: hypothetical protein E7256_11195 [Lachnospiraceae bacterium]|nr:hypothetical protein [Lachnospiraceae bacterium]